MTLARERGERRENKKIGEGMGWHLGKGTRANDGRGSHWQLVAEAIPCQYMKDRMIFNIGLLPHFGLVDTPFLLVT